MKALVFLMAIASATCFVVADDVLVLDENGQGETGRFRVLDHEGDALGLMVSADDKFVKAASVARIAVDASKILVTIDCPVPDGMVAEKSRASAWAGDGVELFIRPSLDSTAYCQYSANAAGVFAARRNSAPDVMDGGWQSAALAESKDTTSGFRVTFSVPFSEVFKSPLKPGDAFGINFTRCGKTCSGMSTWAAVGAKFSNIDEFGRAIFGGPKAYFARRLVQMEGGAPADDKVARALAEAKSAVEEQGGDPGKFASLEKKLADLHKTIVSARLAGKPLVLFCPQNPWGNALAPDDKSRPLERIRLRAARNSRAVAVFAAANLADTPFIGEFKVFDALPTGAKKEQKEREASFLTRYLSFSQGFALANRVGKPVYDPILPLPMNGLLRLAPKESVPMYVELDSHGLAVGVYRAELVLKKAAPGFSDESIALVVEVVDADISEVAVDRAGYDYIGWTHARGKNLKKMLKLLVDRGYNVAYVVPSHLFPKEGKDGVFRVRDFSTLDRQLDALLTAGLPKERMKLWVYMALEYNHPWYAPLDMGGCRCKMGDGKWERGIKAMVREIAAYVKVRYGIGRDRIYWYPIDEPSGEIDDPTFKSSISRAYHAAKVIKEEDSANLTMTDPLPVFLESKAINKALPRLAEVYDVIELYRPKVTDEKKSLVAAQNLKEVWTYSILTKESIPVVYRRDYWQNMRDGYREIATFWHMTRCAGSPFDSNDFTTPGRYDDYASLYVDFANDAALLSRRQLAADMGYEDVRLVMWLRNRFKGDAAMLAKVDAIVKEAADAGTVSAMDEARDRLLDIAKRAK